MRWSQCAYNLPTDFYPFGAVAKVWNNPDQTQQETYRHGYQGQYAEKDTITGWNAFELRMYDPLIGRWLQVDPERQFASPYNGMGNNPMNRTDPTGGESPPWVQKGGQVAWVDDHVYNTDPQWKEWDVISFDPYFFGSKAYDEFVVGDRNGWPMMLEESSPFMKKRGYNLAPLEYIESKRLMTNITPINAPQVEITSSVQIWLDVTFIAKGDVVGNHKFFLLGSIDKIGGHLSVSSNHISYTSSGIMKTNFFLKNVWEIYSKVTYENTTVFHGWDRYPAIEGDYLNEFRPK